jgi:hypothetical protein
MRVQCTRLCLIAGGIQANRVPYSVTAKHIPSPPVFTMRFPDCAMKTSLAWFGRMRYVSTNPTTTKRVSRYLGWGRSILALNELLFGLATLKLHLFGESRKCLMACRKISETMRRSTKTTGVRKINRHLGMYLRCSLTTFGSLEYGAYKKFGQLLRECCIEGIRRFLGISLLN